MVCCWIWQCTTASVCMNNECLLINDDQNSGCQYSFNNTVGPVSCHVWSLPVHVHAAQHSQRSEWKNTGCHRKLEPYLAVIFRHCVRRDPNNQIRLRLRDWSRSVGSYGNNTRVICCPAPGRPESAARGTSPPDNKSRGCCCRNSRPTVINPDYNMTKQRYITRIYDKKTFKITTKSSDVAYLPPLWRHASLLNDGSCSFTHPVAKGRSARGTSPGT